MITNKFTSNPYFSNNNEMSMVPFIYTVVDIMITGCRKQRQDTFKT